MSDLNKNTEAALPFYKKNWFTWVMLIFVFPVGLILLWAVSSYSKKAKILISLAFCALLVFGLQIESPNSTTGYRPQGSSSQSSDTASLSMEKYNRIKTDMSYKEVIEIIGRWGKEQQRVEMNGIKHIVYSWEEEGFSPKAIIVMFENNKVVGKSQLGL